MKPASRSPSFIPAAWFVIWCLSIPLQTTAADLAVKVVFSAVSAAACPAEIISVTTPDGNKATAVVRQPPGPGPFPAIVFLHGGLNQRNVDRVKREVPTMPTNSRFLAAG